MRKYHVMHTHQYGVTNMTVCVPTKDDILTGSHWYNDDDQLKKLATKLGIDYEPHKQENLEITDITDEMPFMLSIDDVNHILTV